MNKNRKRSYKAYRGKVNNESIIKNVSDEPDIWEEITLEEAIEYTEGSGYWKKILSWIC